MIQYKVTTRKAEIIKVTVDRVTVSSVWINGKRRGRRSDEWDNYFDTFNEAKQFLQVISGRRLVSARLELQKAQGFAGNVQGIRDHG